MTAAAAPGPITLPPDPGPVDQVLGEFEQAPPPRETAKDRRAGRTAAKASKPKERVAAGKRGEFIEPLTQMYAMAGLGVTMIDHDGRCGPVIMENAGTIAEKWDELAYGNESVRRALRTLTTGGAWAGVIGAHLPIAIAILSNHAGSLLPASLRSEQEPEQDPGQEPEQPGPVHPEPVPAQPAPRPRPTPRKRVAKKASPSGRAAANERRSSASNG